MSSTSQKHRNFVAEPMGEKACTGKCLISRIFGKSLKFHDIKKCFIVFLSDLAGIGETLGKRLTEKGFDKVRMNERDVVCKI